MAAALGWRSVGRREYAATETGAGSATAVRVGLALTDIAVGICSLSVGMYLVGRFDPSVSLSSGWSLSLAYSTLIWPAVSVASRLYPAYGIASYRELALAVRSGTISAILVGFTALVAPDLFGLDTTVFLLTVPISAVLSPAFRAVAKKLLQSFHLWGRPVVIVGTEPTAARITRHLLNQPGIGLHPLAVFGPEERWGVDDLAVGGGVQQAWDYIKENGSRHLIVTREAASTAAFDEVLLRFSKQLEFVQYLPDLDWLPTNSVVATPIGTSLALRAQNQLASRANRTVKRTLDIVGSSVLLTFLGLPLLLLGMLIRLDSRGPAIYLSPRTGRDGKVFNCIKFRTMHVDADERLALLLEQNPELRAEYEKYHKLTNDPRITRLGRLIRRVSLDELPQLINVFLGQMSLVGPRPYMVREFDIMGEDRDLIFLARPGMTGYWQVDARNDVSFKERQAMEAHYVRNWTVWWDIDLLLRTPGAMAGKTGK